MVAEAPHLRWIATASTVVVGEEEAGVPPIVVVVQEEFLDAQNTEVLFSSLLCFVATCWEINFLGIFLTSIFCFAVTVTGLPSSASWQDLKVVISYFVVKFSNV